MGSGVRIKTLVSLPGDQNTSLRTLSTTTKKLTNTLTNTHAQIPKVFPMAFRTVLFHVFESWGHTIAGVELRPSHISKEINLLKPLSKNPEKFRTSCRDSPGCLSHHAELGRVHKALSFLCLFLSFSLTLYPSKMSGFGPCTGLAELKTIEKGGRECLLGSSREGLSFHDFLKKPSSTQQPSTVKH